MSAREENSDLSLARRESTIQELDHEASSNDEDANAFDLSTYFKIKRLKVKKVRGKEILYLYLSFHCTYTYTSQTYTFPFCASSNVRIKS